MNEDVLPLVLELVYADGQVSEHSVAPVIPPRRKERKGQIYVMLDVDGRAPSSFVEQLRKGVVDAFYKDPSGSLTSSLVRAIRRVNEDLYSENERSIRSDRCYATLCCLVLRGDDAYFALVGRAVCYLVHSSASERLGRGDPQPGERPVDLLGQVDEVEVELHHRTMEDPTTIVLASSGLTDAIGVDADRLLRGQPDRTIDSLRRASRVHHGRRPFRTMIVVPDGRMVQGLVDIPEVMERRPPILRSEGRPRREPVARAPSFVAPEVRRPSIPRSSRSVLLDEADLGDVEAPARHRDWDSFEGTEPPEPAPRRSRRGARQVADNEADNEFEADSVPGRPLRPRIQLRNPFVLPHLSSKFVVALGIAVVLFAIGFFVMFVTARIVQGGAPYTEAISALTQAQQQESEAMGQTDPLVRRHLLQQAQQLVNKALTIRPDDGVAISLATRIRQEYRAASGITDLPAPTRLIALPTAGDQMVLNGIDLYVLDRKNSLIYKYMLNAEGTRVQPSPNPVLVRKGDRVGGATVGNLTQITWMPAGSSRPLSALLALDSAGFLIQYEPTHGLTALRLRDPGAWADVTAISGYAGSLYALDPGHHTLAWYPPQSAGYDGPVYSYFAPGVSVPITDTVGLVASDNLYLLHDTGRVSKFAGGKPVDFAGPPTDLLPSHPAGIALSGDSIYVGDPRRARITQILSTGAYQRDLSAGQNQQILSNMRDLAVSQDGKALYVLSGKAVYRFVLPGFQQ